MGERLDLDELVMLVGERVDRFRHEMRTLGVHVGVNGTCATCDQAWPCSSTMALNNAETRAMLKNAEQRVEALERAVTGLR